MTQTTIDLLQEAEPIFVRIAEHEAAPESLETVLELLDSYEPPQSWVLELPSQLKNGTYKTLPLDLMEAAARRIFGYESGISTISDPIIIQERTGKFSVSVSVEYALGYSYGQHRVHGVASVTSPNIQGLELATPKASSMAVKNALKQLGGFFGKYLNRVEEEVSEVPATPSLQEEIDSLPEAIRKVETLEDLKTFHKLVYSKSISHEVQAIYEQKFRELKGK